MTPSSSDIAYLKNMSNTIYQAMDKADPKAKWILMCWAFKSPNIQGNFWQQTQTKAFFDGVPDDRLIALELRGESWYWTGWYKQNGWYKKDWIWNIIQNFGDQVNMHGGLADIIENHQKLIDSKHSKNLKGIGLAMEGLGYNPVVYEMLAEMMWNRKAIKLETWKKNYLKQRYGVYNNEIEKAWKHIYEYFYTKVDRHGGSIITSRPGIQVPNNWPNRKAVLACKYLLQASKDIKAYDSYSFDLVNLFRQVLGEYAGQLVYKIKLAYEAKDIDRFEEAKFNFLELVDDLDKLMGTRKEFLLGKWINDARACGFSPKEKENMEWNAKSLITLWGPKNHPGCGGLYGYAMKEWSGLYKDYHLPQWEIYLESLQKDLKGIDKHNHTTLTNQLIDWEENWCNTHSELPDKAYGNSIKIAHELWDKYNQDLLQGTYVEHTPKGIAYKKKIESNCEELDKHESKLVVDGLVNKENAWWSSTSPASLTINLEEEKSIFGFHIFPYWDGFRFYQYTIEVSKDKKSWLQIVDKSQNTKPATSKGDLIKFKINYPEGIQAKYVRINMLKNSANESVHLVELKVFESKDLK
jgi:alpha-N-acetylglucosaminidase